ncbi:hypothetical protein ACLFLJ_02495 [Acinetobacter pittii]
MSTFSLPSESFRFYQHTSVRQLIESQAQQLNEARALLKSYLDNN